MRRHLPKGGVTDATTPGPRSCRHRPRRRGPLAVPASLRGVSRLAVCAALAVPMAIPTHAHAQCVTGPEGFTCTGEDIDGIVDLRPNISGEVEDEAVVNGERAVELGDGATLRNDGEIEGVSRGVLAGPDLTLLNSGAVRAAEGGDAEDDRAAVETSGEGEVVNEAGGVIASGGRAILGRGELVALAIDNAGTIASEDGDAISAEGLDFSSFAAVTVANRGGTIRGGGSAIDAEFTDVSNNILGVISGGSNAISALDVELDNAGLIEGGVSADQSAIVLNRRAGILRGGVSSGPGFTDVDNRGLIDGSIFAGQGLDVVNSGTRLGGVSASDDTFGIVNSGLIRTEGDAGLGLSFASPSIDNTGVIVAGRDVAGGDLDASVTNSGRAVAGDDGLDASAVFLTNDGSLVAGDDGAVGSFLARVENAGTIEAGSEGVEGAQVEVDNAAGAVIEGGRTGVLVTGDTSSDDRSEVRNEGRIEGGADGAIRARAAVDVTLGASGAFVGSAGTALALGAGDDTLVIEAGAELEGAARFGAGDDVVTYERSMLEEVMDAFGLFVGGGGTDEFVFTGFEVDDLTTTAVEGAVLVDVADGASGFSATLRGFETLTFGDTTLALDDIAAGLVAGASANAPAPVPLPAGLSLLAAGLGGLWGVRQAARRRGSKRDGASPSVHRQAARGSGPGARSPLVRG